MSKILTKIANSNFVKEHIKQSINKPQYLARTLLLTSVSKDVFAYALRVHNTNKNEEIPKDKRAYVARMDAVTGVVTGVVQVGAGLLVSSEKIQNTVTDKLFKPIAENARALKAAKSAFSVISTMLIATLFAKRIVVPYISSKIASAPSLSKEEICHLNQKTMPCAKGGVNFMHNAKGHGIINK